MEMAGAMESARELDRLHKEQEQVFNEINKIHKRLSQCMIKQILNAEADLEQIEKLGDSIWLKLRSFYAQAKDLAENEVTISSSLMSQLDSLLHSGLSSAQRKKIEVEQKKKRMKAVSDPRLSSAPSARNLLEQLTNLINEQVAARVTADDAEKDEWFIVKVTRFDRETKEFEVLDEEPGDEEESGQRKYKLPMSRIIPFPKRSDPSTAPDFPPGTQVLAVYPGTTALYKATVVNSHRKKKNEDYVLEFDDDEEEGSPGLPQRQIPFYKVVPLPEGHRQ